ncbi:MAG: acylneuraminate cytidylyltransferase family protein [Deltaproteobacteria bacterium]|nr:acylneuraminate cytidylyltransferase family protein [Deltaproteobacteria bacterium]
MDVIGLIPARGESKAIPLKNIHPLCGRPLIEYTAKAAVQSKLLKTTYLSTDSEQIAGAVKFFGVQVPFMRPSEISVDETPMIEVLKHMVAWLRKSSELSSIFAIALLQPTSPLRTSQQIDEAIQLFLSSKAETLVSVTEVPHSFHPSSLYNLNEEKQTSPFLNENKENSLPLRRQDKPKLYARNGPAILILSSKQIETGKIYGNRTFGYLMDRTSSLDIDSYEDLKLAEYYLKNSI